MKKLLKKKLKQILAISMALSMILCTNAFATPIDLVNSTESVVTDTLDKVDGTDYFDDEDTNVWANGQITERVDVTVQRGSEFEITIPKDIVLDGETGTADYIVNAKGDIAGNQKLSVVPDAEFEMTEAGGKDSVTATVTQNDTEYTYQEMLNNGTDYSGSVAATLTAGEWAGKFVFNISFKDVSHTHNYENGVCVCGKSIPAPGQTLEAYSWSEIAEISEAGEAVNYFAVGNEKTFTLNNGQTYTAQIIGFNHDDLADNSGKSGITFQFKKLMSTRKAMNASGGNVGGWEASEMRTYVNNNVYNSLPSDLQAEIKEVSKISDAGNMDTTTLITTTDKLFLLSLEEVGLSYSYNVTGQGEKYEFYSDNTSRIKSTGSSTSDWWLRSTNTYDASEFFCVRYDGKNNSTVSSYTNRVAPAFCI